MSSPKVTEGEADFSVPAAGKPCKTWYKVIGDLQTRTRRPLVALHGGPGLAHHYLSTLADLASTHSIPVVLYDQLGNGASTHLPEKNGDGTFWTDTLFNAELNNLLVHLGIQDAYDLCGHSWGGMLAARHAVQQPPGLHRLVLCSSLASIALWDEAQNDLRVRLPQEVQDVLAKHEEAGTRDSQEYQEALGVFHARHGCKITPFPEELQETLGWAKKDPTVSVTMFGPDVFHTRGTLRGWSIIDDIPKINATTLIVNGRDDTAQNKTLLPHFRSLQRVRWFQFAQSSHTANLEERELFMQVVGGFLTEE